MRCSERSLVTSKRMPFFQTLLISLWVNRQQVLHIMKIETVPCSIKAEASLGGVIQRNVFLQLSLKEWQKLEMC